MNTLLKIFIQFGEAVDGKKIHIQKIGQWIQPIRNESK